MSDLYSEHLVQRKQTVLSKFGKVFFIILAVLSGFLALFIHPLLWIACAAFVALFFLVGPRLEVEFEYLHVNGELDIDKIFSKEQRKRALSIDLNNMEIIAPSNSHRLDSYKSRNTSKTYDFSSHIEGHVVYEMYLAIDNSFAKVLLELDERMLNDIKLQSPRKVFTD